MSVSEEERAASSAEGSGQTGWRVLVAGIGNIFLGDDGFGCALAQRAQGRYPPDVVVIDFGIRGLDLAYTLLDGDYSALVLVDAVLRGGQPGTLYVLEPAPPVADAAAGLSAGRLALEAHSMDPVRVLAFAAALGARPVPTLLLGCEPTPLPAGESAELPPMGLSAPVEAALPEALNLLDRLIARLRAQAHQEQQAPPSSQE